MPVWNPWHGCKKISAGCQNCYVYRRDSQFGKDSSKVEKTKDFSLPLSKRRDGEYKLLPGEGPVYTCMTSDFFIKEADGWRDEIWSMIRLRSDLHFVIITKRIDRMSESLPDDWGNGYCNVTVICTCEDKAAADYRLPIFLKLPIFRREIIHEPMLEGIDVSEYLATGMISKVTCGGESGENARLCNFDWVLSSREQCIKNHVDFHFKQTGANFKKGGRLFNISRVQQMSQAKRANIDYRAFDDIFRRLSRSEFRSRFCLRGSDREYAAKNGMDAIRRHARDFVERRLAPAVIPNDGKQTPMRGHPVFLAQHATATCCRGCLSKWHGISPAHELTEDEKRFAVSLICEWIYRQMLSAKLPGAEHNMVLRG